MDDQDEDDLKCAVKTKLLSVRSMHNLVSSIMDSNSKNNE